jgi:DNA-binding HxlR family transcriptional regulator
MLEILEERGFVNQIVGSVAPLRSYWAITDDSVGRARISSS